MVDTSGMRVPMIFGYKEWYPHVTERAHNGRRELEGLIGRIIHTVLESMNISYVLKDSEDYGYFLPNGTGTGTMRMLQEKETDAIPIPFGLDLDMFTQFHAMPLVRNTDLHIMTGTMKPFVDNAFAIAIGFDPVMGILIAVTLLTLTLLTVLLEGTGITSWFSLVLSYWAQLFMEPSSVLPSKPSTRALFGAWLLGCLVVNSWFSAVICGSLLVQVPSKRIDTADDLLNATHIRPTSIDNIPLLAVMRMSTKPSVRRVYWKMQELHGQLPVETVYSLDYLRGMQEQKHSLVIDMTSMSFVEERTCPHLKGFFYFGEEIIDVLRMTWYTRKDLPPDILQTMNKRTTRIIESGLEFMRPQAHTARQYTCTLNTLPKGNSVRYDPLTLKDIHFISIICGFWLVAAAIALVAELAFVYVILPLFQKGRFGWKQPDTEAGDQTLSHYYTRRKRVYLRS